MQLAALLTILTKAEQAQQTQRSRGFRVTWAWYDGTTNDRDYSPEKGEAPIESEPEAWALAQRIANIAEFASKQEGRRLVDIYVTDADGVPVPSAEKRMLLRWLGRVDSGAGVMAADGGRGG